LAACLTDMAQAGLAGPSYHSGANREDFDRPGGLHAVAAILKLSLTTLFDPP
jgi:hypothetical protein